MSTKRIKHNKIRNTGLLFEFLLRQVTSDVLKKSEKSKALEIIKTKFNENTELGKERALYNIIINKRFNSDKKADFFINEVILARQKLNNSRLKREKFNVIKEIKDVYDLQKLLSSKVPDYKVYASVYKLFEYNDKLRPEEKTESHFNLIENLTSKKSIQLKDTVVIPDDPDLRIISYRILLEKFNEKYSYLDGNQKSLLKAYINGVSNTNSLTEYVQEQIPIVKRVLKRYLKRVDDKVTRIKLNEAIKSIDKFCNADNRKSLKDSVVIQLMRYFQLVKELKKI